MRAVGVHSDAVVVTSRLRQTTATVLRDGEEAMLVDSPYFPDELEALPELLEQVGFRVDALLATHADFDHLLGRLAFPGLALGLAESSALRLRAAPGTVQRELRAEDERTYVTRDRPLSLGGVVEALPVPGHLELGTQEVELHPTAGHTADGLAVHAPHLGVLVCGDYLSGVEIPTLEGHASVTEYRATLARLAPLVDAADTVVPGHGPPQSRDAALRTLDEDVDYLDALERGEERPSLPPARASARQRELHARNLRAVGGG